MATKSAADMILSFSLMCFHGFDADLQDSRDFRRGAAPAEKQEYFHFLGGQFPEHRSEFAVLSMKALKGSAWGLHEWPGEEAKTS